MRYTPGFNKTALALAAAVAIVGLTSATSAKAEPEGAHHYWHERQDGWRDHAHPGGWSVYFGYPAYGYYGYPAYGSYPYPSYGYSGYYDTGH